MLKTKIYTGLMTASTLLGMGAGIVTASADTPTPSTATGSSKIVLTGDNAPKFDNNTDGTAGVPSFDFGTHALTDLGKDGSETGLTQAEGTVSNLNVTDLDGTGNGYDVTAKLANMAGTADTTHTLGAKLNLVPGAVTSSDKTVVLPTASNTTLEAGGDAQTIMTAAKGQGMGAVTANYGKSTLDVANAKYADTYTGAITYTLAQTPTQTTELNLNFGTVNNGTTNSPTTTVSDADKALLSNGTFSDENGNKSKLIINDGLIKLQVADTGASGMPVPKTYNLVFKINDKITINATVNVM